MTISGQKRLSSVTNLKEMNSLKQFSFFLLFHFGFQTAFGSELDSLQSGRLRISEEISKRGNVIVKAGGLFNGNNFRESFNTHYLGIFVEVGLGENASLNFGSEINESFTSYSNDIKGVLDYKYFFNSLDSPESIRTFSGTYLASSFYLKAFDGAANELPFSFSIDPSLNRPFELNYGIGLKVGQQYQGLIDFGVFVGIENSKNRNSNLGNRFYPILTSYSRLALPIGNKEFNNIWRANLNHNIDHSSLIKFSLNDVLNVSKKGLFFHPKIAFEKGIGKMGLALNVMGEGLIMRAKYFDVTYENQTIISEKSFLHQYLEFIFTPQIRYYLSQNWLRKKESNLEGLYLHVNSEMRSGSEEVKRKYWEYNKSSSVAYGGGLGFQKMLMGGILLDAHTTISRTNDAENKFVFGGGINVYWAK